jgi:hypothetical protein
MLAVCGFVGDKRQTGSRPCWQSSEIKMIPLYIDWAQFKYNRCWPKGDKLSKHVRDIHVYNSYLSIFEF